jgi:polyhydroxyalkanoate synthesis regulator phasin
MRTAADIGMAGGAIALALVKHLIYKGDLTLEEAKVILTDAQKRLIDFPDGVESARMLREIYEKVVKEAEYF